MKKFLCVLALSLVLASCFTVSPTVSNQNVLETWTGFATGYGGECSDAKVKVKILDDLSIVGKAHSTDFNMVISLKGKLHDNGSFNAYGSGSGGVTVEYKGTLVGDTGNGTWTSSRVGCHGTWVLVLGNR